MTATGGEQAVAQDYGRPAALVLLEATLPKEDGYQVAGNARMIGRGPGHRGPFAVRSFRCHRACAAEWL